MHTSYCDFTRQGQLTGHIGICVAYSEDRLCMFACRARMSFPFAKAVSNMAGVRQIESRPAPAETREMRSPSSARLRRSSYEMVTVEGKKAIDCK